MQKRILLILLMTGIFGMSYAQKARGKAKAKQDSLTTLTPKEKKDKLEKMKLLNLTSEQQEKVKALSQTIRNERKQIESDKSLSADAKKDKVKALRAKQMKGLQEILTPEQLEKFKDLRKNNKDKDNDED